MTPILSGLLDWAPAFVLIFARVGGAMILLPALGEAVASPMVRIGLALSLTVLLLPELYSIIPSVSETRFSMAAMIGSEVVTGLWFGWIARMVALALPVCAQFIGYLIGLSNILQPDIELGSQSSALGKLFETAAPAILLGTGLYQLPITALSGLYRLVPFGHMLPPADSADVVLKSVAATFSLAVQLASPFVAIAIVWHLAMGQVARFVSRLQIYFVSVPGQILVGLFAIIAVTGTVVATWRDACQLAFLALPGAN